MSKKEINEKASQRFSRNELIALTFFFLVSYFIQFFLSIAGKSIEDFPVIGLFFPLKEWINPNYFLMPFVAFFLVLFGIIYVKETFGFKNIMKWFPFAFFAFALIGFYINLMFYFFVAGRTDAVTYICVAENCSSVHQSILVLYQQQGLQVQFVDFWNELRQTSYAYFILSGLLAWASIGLTNILKEKKLI